MSEAEIGRLRWRCRRGMRELDAALASFLDTGFAALTPAERAAFSAFLDLPDPDIHALLLGRRDSEEPDVARIVATIRRSARAAP